MQQRVSGWLHAACVRDAVRFLDDKWTVLQRAWLCLNPEALIKARGKLYRNELCVCADKQFERNISSKGHFSQWHWHIACDAKISTCVKIQSGTTWIKTSRDDDDDDVMEITHTHVPCWMCDYMSGIHCDRALKSSPRCVKLQIKWWWHPISLPAVSMTTAEVARLQWERLVKCCGSDCCWWERSQES